MASSYTVPAPPVGQLDYPGAVIRMYVSSSFEQEARLGACAKEPWTVQWIEAMRPDQTLYDIGANVGSYTLLAAARGINVVAFEPGPAHYTRLCQNVALNGLQTSVIALPCALGPANAMVVMQQSPTPAYTSGDLSMTTPVLALDRVAAIWDIPPPTHIKLDVEGAEPQVLAGATRTLHEAATVMVEMGGPRDAMVVQALERAGLERVGQWQTHRAGVAYALYARPDSPA